MWLAALEDEGDEGEHEDVGHGVVGAAFEFKGGPEPVPEVEAAAAEDGEDGGGVGAAHGGGEEEATHECDANLVGQNEIEDEAGGHGGEQHADGGEHDAGAEDGAYVLDFGVEAAGKEDGAQGHGAYHLRHLDVVEVDAEAVAAEEHADAEEKQQGRHAEARARLACQNAGKEEDGEDEEVEFYLHNWDDNAENAVFIVRNVPIACA